MAAPPPRNYRASPARTDKPIRKVGSTSKMRSSGGNQRSPRSTPCSVTTSPGTPNPPEPTTQLLIRRGFEVIIAVDGKEGVDTARREKPDIILMDMSLPVIDGWE